MPIEGSVTIDVRRETSATGSAGGRTITHTAAARGSLPTSFEGVPITIGQMEKLEYGVRGDRIGWIVVTETDPQVDARDVVDWTDMQGKTWTARVLARSIWPIPTVQQFQFPVEDVTTED